MTSSVVNVVSMCNVGHLDVWKLTSHFLPEHVAASNYTVYVPENQIPMFQIVNNSGIQIRSQESLDVGYTELLEYYVSEADNYERFGWYLQQFHKIQALLMQNADVVTIWDADCVPIKTIRLTDDLGRPHYTFSSEEFHLPYFDNIQRLLGLEKIQAHSFVIPGFPIRHVWIQELVEFLEQKHNSPWFEAIMRNTDFSQRSGFSETETMGTWVTHRYSGKWSYGVGHWERHGQSQFGFARNLSASDLERISSKYPPEIVSFENWDLPRFALLGRLWKIWRDRNSRNASKDF